MRRLFIIRKDLHLSSGKLAAMVAHCAEAYWTSQIRNSIIETKYYEDHSDEVVQFEIDSNIMQEYICGAFVKTICQAKNLTRLKKAATMAEEMGLVEGRDWGYINDNCYTELTPENEDGTCTVGIWFKPLSDEKAHQISKKFHLYTD